MESDLQIELTAHGIQRCEERLGVKPAAVRALVARAWRRGHAGDDGRGGLVRVFANHRFVFARAGDAIRFVTVFPLAEKRWGADIWLDEGFAHAVERRAQNRRVLRARRRHKRRFGRGAFEALPMDGQP